MNKKDKLYAKCLTCMFTKITMECHTEVSDMQLISHCLFMSIKNKDMVQVHLSDRTFEGFYIGDHLNIYRDQENYLVISE